MGRILDVINDKRLEKLKKQVEEFASAIMGDYLDSCKNSCKNKALSAEHTKSFYDSVWGTIEINEGEIFILNSPLLQRLRHIKQLGLADLLYSSANHSRFSHTLGVLQAADAMTIQIEKELKKNHVSTRKDTKQLIRLAAIFHDCGHMVASHASEQFFQKNRDYPLYNMVKDVRRCFRTNLGIKEPALSEIISLLFVNSPAVRDLLGCLEKGLDGFDFSIVNRDIAIEKICCFIIGFPFSEDLIPYSQVICGRIDSDKLDYLKRDSHSTGVPVAVDMSRVFQKLRVVQSKKNRTMLAVGGGHQVAYKIAIAPAAINTIDQLIISRFMMFENIYYHQKTLTAEEMLRYAFLKISTSTKGILDSFSKILFLTDDIVIHNNFSKSVLSVIDRFEITDPENFEKGCAILANLYDRRLFKRCAAFSERNLTKAISKENDFYSKVVSGTVVEEQKKFMNLVIDEIKRIKNLLDPMQFSFSLNTDALLLIYPDVSVSLESNIAIADKTNKDRDAIFESDKWLQSRASQKTHYIVSYPEDRYIVYIAVEMVLLRDYGVLINDTLIFSEEDDRYIIHIKNFLNNVGYFNKHYTLMPDSTLLAFDNKMSLLIDKWKTYEIYDTNTGLGHSIDITYLTTHIKQFMQFTAELGDFGVFLNGYLEMLNEVRIISKPDIAKALFQNLKNIQSKENCGFDNLKICNIGSVQDSSAILAYHVNIINAFLKTSLKTKSLEDVLSSVNPGQAIVFLEDAFCSGKQILSIFETYMGVPIEERQTQEEHVKELADDLKEKLKKCHLYFSFIMYEKDNESFFRSRMDSIGLKHIEIVATETFPKGYFTVLDGLDDSEIQKRILVKKYLEKAGERLIACKSIGQDGKRKKNWDDKRIEQSTLGYNDSQQLVAFSWNTPTYTITPLWMSADTPNFQWIPLFPRIDK